MKHPRSRADRRIAREKAIEKSRRQLLTHKQFLVDGEAPVLWTTVHGVGKGKADPNWHTLTRRAAHPRCSCHVCTANQAAKWYDVTTRELLVRVEVDIAVDDHYDDWLEYNKPYEHPVLQYLKTGLKSDGTPVDPEAEWYDDTHEDGCYCVVCLDAVKEDYFVAHRGCCGNHVFEDPCTYN